MNTETVKLKGFCLYPSVYFVGDERVSVHLIDTGAGLVMIDTGYPNMLDVILKNVEAVGFSVGDIRAIFHSHGHIDHFGCTQEIVKRSGAKTYISRIDNDILNGTLDLSWAKELNCTLPPPFSCDVLIEDGDVFSFGDVSVRCVHTPGHTDGVMSFLITLADGTVAGMHGGIGANTLSSKFIRKYGLSFDCRRHYRESIDKLWNERVDLVLGNHPEQSDTLGKMMRILKGETDVRASEEWHALLKRAKATYQRVMETDPE
jgi:metallo-beta-lactamase class B